MYELVTAWQQSGQSQKAFARSSNIPFARFNYWARKKKQEEESKVGFVRIEPDKTEAGTTLEVVYPNGVRVSVPAADLPLISRLIGLR